MKARNTSKVNTKWLWYGLSTLIVFFIVAFIWVPNLGKDNQSQKKTQSSANEPTHNNTLSSEKSNLSSDTEAEKTKEANWITKWKQFSLAKQAIIVTIVLFIVIVISIIIKEQDKLYKINLKIEKLKNNKAPLPDLKEYKVGDKVKLSRGKTGVVRYVGTTAFSNGEEVIGLCLDEWTAGAHKAIVGNIEYFDCPKGRGYFTRRQDISGLVVPGESLPAPA